MPLEFFSFLLWSFFRSSSLLLLLCPPLLLTSSSYPDLRSPSFSFSFSFSFGSVSRANVSRYTVNTFSSSYCIQFRKLEFYCQKARATEGKGVEGQRKESEARGVKGEAAEGKGVGLKKIVTMYTSLFWYVCRYFRKTVRVQYHQYITRGRKVVTSRKVHEIYIIPKLHLKRCQVSHSGCSDISLPMSNLFRRLMLSEVKWVQFR